MRFSIDSCARIATAVALVSGLAGAASAHADDARAEAAFVDGQRFLAAGDLEQACPSFARAVALSGAEPVRELLALAACHEQAGRSGSAFLAYQRAAVSAGKKGQASLRLEAEAALARIEPKLVRVRIVVAPAVGAIVGLSVSRGLEQVENDAWGVAVPVDPGRVVIRAEAPGRQPFTRELTVAEGDAIHEVRIDALGEAPLQRGEAPPIPTANPLAEPIDDPRWGRLGTAGAIIGGAGLTTLAVSLGLALKASSDKDDAIADPAFACGRDGCNAAGEDALEDARYLGDVATATALIGGTLTAAGLTMVIVELAAPVVKQQSIAVRVGPAGLVLGGRF